MILETYAPESSCQSPIICRDLQHSSRSWTRRGGHSRSGHTRWSGRHTRWSGHSRRRTIVYYPGGSGGGNPYPGIGMLPSPDIGVIGVPDGGAKPGGGIGCPGFIVTLYRSWLMLLLSQPTIVPSFGHVPLPCPQTPLSSPDVET